MKHDYSFDEELSISHIPSSDPKHCNFTHNYLDEASDVELPPAVPLLPEQFCYEFEAIHFIGKCDVL